MPSFGTAQPLSNDADGSNQLFGQIDRTNISSSVRNDAPNSQIGVLNFRRSGRARKASWKVVENGDDKRPSVASSNATGRHARLSGKPGGASAASKRSKDDGSGPVGRSLSSNNPSVVVDGGRAYDADACDVALQLMHLSAPVRTVSPFGVAVGEGGNGGARSFNPLAANAGIEASKNKNPSAECAEAELPSNPCTEGDKSLPDPLVTGARAGVETTPDPSAADAGIEATAKPSAAGVDSSSNPQKAPSRVDRFKNKGNEREQLSCNFTDHTDMREKFPYLKGRGTFNVPMGFLNNVGTAQAKRKVVLEWRLLYSSQQRAKLDEQWNNLSKRRQAEKTATDKEKRANKRAKKKAGPMKRKTKQSTVGSFADNEAEWEASIQSKDNQLEWQRRENERRKEERKKQKEEREMSGFLSQDQNAAAMSAMARAVKSTKERSAKEKPTEIHQLRDKTATRMSNVTEKAAIRFAASNQPEVGNILRGGYHDQVLTTITNVPTPARNGGGADSELALNQDPKGMVVALGGIESIKRVHAVLGHVISQHGDDTENHNPQTGVKTVFSAQQYEDACKERKKKRAKAPKGKSHEDIIHSLASVAQTGKRKIPLRRKSN